MIHPFSAEGLDAAVVPPPLTRHATTSRLEGLSGLEWSVVALARNDRLSTLRSPGRIAVAMGGLFGTRHNPRLADSRLEALRRIAVLTWHRGFAVKGYDVKAFTGAGYTLDQYELLVLNICRARTTAAGRGR